MYCVPLAHLTKGFEGNVKVIDQLKDCPTTRFSDESPSLIDSGIDVTNPEHAFFECYLKFLADPSFCPNGVMNTNSALISLLP